MHRVPKVRGLTEAEVVILDQPDGAFIEPDAYDPNAIISLIRDRRITVSKTSADELLVVDTAEGRAALQIHRALQAEGLLPK